MIFTEVVYSFKTNSYKLYDVETDEKGIEISRKLVEE